MRFWTSPIYPKGYRDLSESNVLVLGEIMSYIPNLHDWTELRKYIAVVKQEHNYWERDIENTDLEPMIAFEPVVLYFYNFTGAYKTNEQLCLVFEEEGYQTEVLIDDVDIYAFSKPSILSSIENKVKQHQIT